MDSSKKFKYLETERRIHELLKARVGPLLTELMDRKESSLSIILGHQLNRSFQHYYTLKNRLLETTVDCAFVALAKSGKSTLLNALIGASLLPSSNVPETARIVSIEHIHQDKLPWLVFEGQTELEVVGEEAIQKHLRHCNSEVRAREHKKRDEDFLTIHARIEALRSVAGGQGVKLRLVDTPGPNEAGEDNLRYQVERLLDSVDAVVYILDYTKLKSTDEAQLLASLKHSNPGLVKRLCQRLFFVVNKFDQRLETEGLQEEDLMQYVADLVTAQVKSEAFQLQPWQVLPVSAQDALLSRLILLGKATEEEKARFVRKAWGRSKKARSDEEMQEAAQDMFEESRLGVLEERLLSYLYTNAGGLKLMSMIDSLIGLLTEIQNVAKVGEAALQQTAAELEEESKQLQASLEQTLEEFSVVQEEADCVEVQARMQTLRERLFAYISEALSPEREPELPEVKVGRWRGLWDKAVNILRGSGHNEEKSEEELRRKLKDLHEAITHQLENEVKDFWHELEVVTNERQRHLVAESNKHLNKLARKVESVMGSALDLYLEPVNIRMEAPTAQDFHNSLQELFSAGIKQKRRTEHRVKTEEYEVTEERKGWCNKTEYYQRPETRVVGYEEHITTFQLHPEEIKNYFITMVSQTIDVSVGSVRGYVKAFVGQRVKLSKIKIQEYVESYSSTILSSLQVKNQGAEEQEAGLKALREHLSTVSSLLAASHEIMEAAAAGMHSSPCQGADGFQAEEASGEKEAVVDCKALPVTEPHTPPTEAKAAPVGGAPPTPASEEAALSSFSLTPLPGSQPAAPQLESPSAPPPPPTLQDALVSQVGLPATLVARPEEKHLDPKEDSEGSLDSEWEHIAE